jgi:hypothetical protein
MNSVQAAQYTLLTFAMLPIMLLVLGVAMIVFPVLRGRG